MASRFWVGGTGTWDASDTTHWSATSGGAGGASVPSAADDVTFNGNSGGGTVTLNFGGTITITSLTCGAFTGTLDNSVNNNNMTLSATSSPFNASGSGTRTLKLGTATYTLTGNSASWDFQTVTNLTYTGNTSANIVYTGSSGTRLFRGGGLSHGNVTFGASTGAGIYQISGANTLASLTITGPNFVTFPNLVTTTISNAFTWAGSSSSQIAITSDSSTFTNAATIAAAASSTAQWCSFRNMTFTGSPTATDGFSLGNNSGITITPPGGAGSSITTGGVIGS